MRNKGGVGMEGMKTISVLSGAERSGKSALCVGMMALLAERGMSVGYFKPLGNVVVESKHNDGTLVDDDALRIKELFNLHDSLDTISPVLYTDALIHDALKGERTGIHERVISSFEKIGKDRDVVLVEGAGSLGTGSIAGLSGWEIAEMLDSPVLLVCPYREHFEDETLTALKLLETVKVCGVVINDVPIPQMEWANLFLERISKEVPFTAAIPSEPRLRTVLIGEIVDTLGGAVLTGEDKLDREVSSIVVGALDVSSSVSTFCRRRDAVIVTGTMRSEVIATALGCPVGCVVVCGDNPPESTLISYAHECGVPIIHTRSEILEVIETIDLMLSGIRATSPEKVEIMKELLRRWADVDLLMDSLR
ncbi:MAG: AAA family ATPase [Methermicoccaceae archaeon]